MPAGSRTSFLPVAKAKIIRSNSNASVITYLRTEGYCTERIPTREEQSGNMGTKRSTLRFSSSPMTVLWITSYYSC
ncbi:hypothetical protein BTVI_154668 [Pitangus sulphuratus]|nr:hypothetical protein BTVI_154668 [Pitangus sulphuratus]